MSAEKEKKRLIISIKSKAVIMIIVFALVLCAVSMWVCGRVINNVTDEMYQTNATDLSSTTARMVDVGRFVRLRDEVMRIYRETPEDQRVATPDADEKPEAYEAYVSRFSAVKETEDFKELLKTLKKIQNVNHVDCIYLVCVDFESKRAVYIVDAAEDGACEPGSFDSDLDGSEPVLSDPKAGFPAYVSNIDPYGWLVTAGVAIYDEDGTPVGYAVTDISMEQIRYEKIGYVMRLLTFLLITVVLICVIGLIAVHFSLVKPIAQLTVATRNYFKKKETQDVPNENKRVFSELRIRTGDELEGLAYSMAQMEDDIDEHIRKMVAMHDELSESRQYANEMTELANMDSLTGVRNRTSYDREVKKLDASIAAGDARFGLAVVDLNCLKAINDTGGHDAGNRAIVNLCRIICGIFVHSPVFRIGGDEFAVILQNNDYEKVETLVDEFMEKAGCKKGQPKTDPDHVTGAIGYALFDREIDTDVLDVFRRADRNMYECKTEMKKA